MTGPVPAPPQPRETQVDRTRLAWRRTTLTATVVMALAVRELVGRGPQVLRSVALITLMVGWLGLVLLAERRIADLVDRGQTQAGRRPAFAVLLTLVIAVAGLSVAMLRG